MIPNPFEPTLKEANAAMPPPSRAARARTANLKKTTKKETPFGKGYLRKKRPSDPKQT